MIHKFNVGMDGKLEEQASMIPTTEDEMARAAISLVTSGATEPNKALPASLFAQGVKVIKGAADSFTRNCMAQSKPVKLGNSFDTRGTDKWLAAQKATATRSNGELSALLINK
jgi:hypothetical protein